MDIKLRVNLSFVSALCFDSVSPFHSLSKCSWLTGLCEQQDDKKQLHKHSSHICHPEKTLTYCKTILPYAFFIHQTMTSHPICSILQPGRLTWHHPKCKTKQDKCSKGFKTLNSRFWIQIFLKLQRWFANNITVSPSWHMIVNPGFKSCWKCFSYSRFCSTQQL